MLRLTATVALFLATALYTVAQRVAMIEPENGSPPAGFSSAVRERLAISFRMIDDGLALTAFRSAAVVNPFNLTTADARRIGTAIGCHAYVLLRSGVQRRESLDRPAYFEAHAAAWIVDTRTGRLLEWHHSAAEAQTAPSAERRLVEAVDSFAEKITGTIEANRGWPARDASFEEVPPENSPLSKGLRPPVPYRRVRPEYTPLAFLHGVRATVEIEADIDAEGRIARTSIERWAGYGLDQAVENAVRSMNWRPAERGGKTLPMRVLLRYNFTRIAKDGAN